MSKKFISILIAVVFTVAFLFSDFYIIDNIHHDCTGDLNCPVCQEIDIAETFLSTIKYVPAVLAVIVYLALATETLTYHSDQNFILDTLVSLKVKMLN